MSTSTTYICDVCKEEQSTSVQFWTFTLSLKPYEKSGFTGGHAKTFDACRDCAEKFGMLSYVSTPKPEEPPTLENLLELVIGRLQDQ